MMYTVHMEGGWDREGVNICSAEVYCPHGGRVGQRGGQHPPRCGGARSTIGSVSVHGLTDISSRELRCPVHKEGVWEGGASSST